jgi:hypothetical protein
MFDASKEKNGFHFNLGLSTQSTCRILDQREFQGDGKCIGYFHGYSHVFFHNREDVTVLDSGITKYKERDRKTNGLCLGRQTLSPYVGL